MKSITVQEYKALRDAGTEHQLIDVREPHEYELCNLGGELIPLATVLQNGERINPELPVIVMCRSGKRSANAINQLESAFGLANLTNLEGGILQWADEIDASIPKY